MQFGQDNEIEELREDLNSLWIRYRRLVRLSEVVAIATLLILFGLFIDAPWNADKREANSASQSYYSAQSLLAV